MAIRVQYTKRFNGIQWKSGHFYKFKYQAWENDPEPVILLMYSFAGIHPNTGHEWRFIQGINFTYIPRTHRKAFVNRWMMEWEHTNGNFQLTWQRLSNDYPMVKDAVRRYFYKPSYYITKAIEIPMEDIDSVVVGTWSKDFSKKVRTNLVQKMRRVKQNIQRLGRSSRR
jgi:hypothetical protein